MGKLELSREQQEVFAEALREAGAGKLPWLAALVEKAGFIRRDLSGMKGQDVAAVYGVTAQAVSVWATRGHCPRDAKTRLYNLAEVIHWRERQIGDDAGMTGGNSPALEEFRRTKTKLAQLDLRERERDLIPRAPVFTCLERGAGILRRCFEGIARRHPAIYEEVLEAIDAWEREWGATLGAGEKP